MFSDAISGYLEHIWMQSIVMCCHSTLEKLQFDEMEWSVRARVIRQRDGYDLGFRLFA